MHKETLIAVGIGLILGLVLTFGIYQWQKASNQKMEFSIVGVTPTPPTEGIPTNQEVIINNPQDGTISQQSRIALEGTGPAKAFLVVFVNNKEVVSKIDAEKKFKTEVELNKGPNTITVIAIENNGNTYKTEILVVYQIAE